jgi:hypothetical protein
VSGKLPQTYILHTVGIAIVIAAGMIAFLIHSWG